MHQLTLAIPIRFTLHPRTMDEYRDHFFCKSTNTGSRQALELAGSSRVTWMPFWIHSCITHTHPMYMRICSCFCYFLSLPLTCVSVFCCDSYNLFPRTNKIFALLWAFFPFFSPKVLHCSTFGVNLFSLYVAYLKYVLHITCLRNNLPELFLENLKKTKHLWP